MGGLLLQRRLSAEILKVGQTKIWMDSEHSEDIKNAITRADVRKMISHGYIKAKKEKLKKPAPVSQKKRGIGKRKGSKRSKVSKKRLWINTIRPLRSMLKQLRDEEKIDVRSYRKLYLLAKGGVFRNRTHLRLYLEQRGMINENGT